MMQIGLKFWSTNSEPHRQAAIALAERGIYDFLEIYVVPGSLDRLECWREVPIPKVIHAPHLVHHFNFADARLAESNRRVFGEVQRYADELGAELIVCHGGTGGTPAETVRQLRALHESRILLENKPFWQHPDLMPAGDRHCRGAVFEEFVRMVNELNVRTCHDVTHTVCMANSLKLDPWREIARFETTRPVLHHLSDLTTANDELDMHDGIGEGELDWEHALRLIAPDARLTLETPKHSPDNLDDFASEVRLIRSRGF